MTSNHWLPRGLEAGSQDHRPALALGFHTLRVWDGGAARGTAVCRVTWPLTPHQQGGHPTGAGLAPRESAPNTGFPQLHLLCWNCLPPRRSTTGPCNTRGGLERKLSNPVRSATDCRFPQLSVTFLLVPCSRYSLTSFLSSLVFEFLHSSAGGLLLPTVKIVL